MVTPTKAVDISNNPDAIRIAEEVQATGEPTLLQRDGKPVAVVVPVEKPKKRRQKSQPMTADDSLWGLLGAGSSGGSNIAEHKHEYLADAIEGHRRE